MTSIGSARALALALLFVVSLAGDVRADGTFHSGGVGYCGGCHMSHEDPSVTGGPNLLRRANATDTCLVCHATDDGNTWGGTPLAPGPIFGGGSFIFLTEDNINDGPGGGDPINWIAGDHAGHNVISIQYGVSVDPDYTTSPGGTYPSQHLTCTSCHDPHNKAGNYRMLYARTSPASQSDGYLFSYDADPPEAAGIPLDGPPESRTNHAAYQDRWTQWCEACHAGIHRGGGGGGGGGDPAPTSTSGTGGIVNIASSAPAGGDGSSFLHRTDGRLSGNARDMYDAYDGTGFDTTGDPGQSYIPEVALQFPLATTSFSGPTPQESELSCLTCHRAHASSAPGALRWDPNIATWFDEGRESNSYPIPNPYVTTADQAQRPLCDKCHGTGN